jgi:hypothetical protein
MKLGYLCAAFVLLAACSSSETTDPGPVGPGNTGGESLPRASGDEAGERIRFAGDIESAMAGEYEGVYDILAQRDIVAVVDVPADDSIQFLKLDLFQPDGSEYQTIWRAFTTDTSAPAQVPHPTLNGDVPVSEVEVVGGKAFLYIGIPIAGTDITRLRLAGSFAVEARVGMGDGPALSAGAFELVMPEMK